MSWEQMLSIYAEAVGYAEKERSDPPLACPNDGEPLRSGPNGELFCPSDGYSWPRERRRI